METRGMVWAREVNQLFADQSGIISIDQLLASGVSLRSTRRMVATGNLDTVLPGIFRSAAWPMGRDQIMAAGCLRNPLAALAFTTAGQIHGLRKMTDASVHLLVPHGSSPDLPGLIVHRCRRIDPQDVIDLCHGKRVTSVARTLFDAGAIIGPHRVRSALEHALDRKLVTLEDIAETTARLFHKRRPGSREIKYALAARSEWTAAVQSDLELRVLKTMQRMGLPTPQLQYELILPDGSKIRFDFAWPRAFVALEVDHSFWHAGSSESRSDKRRDRLATQAGWTTIRITEDDLADGLDEVLGQVASIITASLASRIK